MDIGSDVTVFATRNEAWERLEDGLVEHLKLAEQKSNLQSLMGFSVATESLVNVYGYACYSA